MGKKKFEQVSPTSALDADLLAGAASLGAPPPVAPVPATPARTPEPEADTANVVDAPRPERPPASPADEAQRRDERAPGGPEDRVRVGPARDETPRHVQRDETVDTVHSDGVTLAAIQDLHAAAKRLRSRQAAMAAQLAELLDRPEDR